MPPGARQFASRQAWGRQVAYQSQFQTWYDRALTAGQNLRCKLGGPDWAGYDEFDPQSRNGCGSAPTNASWPDPIDTKKLPTSGWCIWPRASWGEVSQQISIPVEKKS